MRDRDPGAPSAGRDLLIADGHVHVHSCFSTANALASAADNLAQAGRDIRRPGTGTRLHYLLLTECCGEDFFEQLLAGTIDAEPWVTSPTSEGESLFAEDELGRKLVIVAGRQVTTIEGLEVLALGTRSRLESGLSLADALEAAHETASFVVVPWGFGKWTGKRGRILEEVLSGGVDEFFFLGDNGGRPKGIRPPPLMARAAARGIRVLPGSDPLPFPPEEDRLGSSGFAVKGHVDLRYPLRSLQEALADGARPLPFLRPRSLVSFAGCQARMQLRKMYARLSPA